MSTTFADEATTTDRRVADLATTQGGAFSTAQARALGASASMVRRRREAGRWRCAAPGVYIVAGAPTTESQRRWVVRLSLGDEVTISHQWAGRAQRLPAMPADVWSVTLPPGDHRRRRGLVVHQQRLDPVDKVLLDGVFMTTLPRTICDLAMVIAPARLRVVVDAARFDLGCSFTAMGEALLRVGTVGRPGASSLVRVLDERGPGRDVALTALEAELDGVLFSAGMAHGSAEHPLPGAGGRSGLVDRAFPDAKLIVEADGRRWHARMAAMATDRQRDFEAARVGWQTVRLMHEHLAGDPDDIARGLADTYLGRLTDPRSAVSTVHIAGVTSASKPSLRQA
jgi:hypothetical protein